MYSLNILIHYKYIMIITYSCVFCKVFYINMYMYSLNILIHYEYIICVKSKVEASENKPWRLGALAVCHMCEIKSGGQWKQALAVSSTPSTLGLRTEASTEDSGQTLSTLRTFSWALVGGFYVLWVHIHCKRLSLNPTHSEHTQDILLSACWRLLYTLSTYTL